jgi:hypothetical protein
MRVGNRTNSNVRMCCDAHHKRAELESLLRLVPVVPIREFDDADGVKWKVWSTIPYTTGVLGSMRGGWLTFESPDFRLRLVPIPTGWEDASVARLRGYCRQAQPAGQTPITGTRRIERDGS